MIDLAGMSRVWAETLNVADVPPDADFFTYGGQSILGVRLARRVQREFGVPVSLEDLLDHPVLAEFTELLNRRQAAEREGR